MTEQATTPQAEGTAETTAPVDVTNVQGSVSTTMTEAPAAENPLSDAPKMPEGGQEKYWDAEKGTYDWESAYKEQAWIASQQSAQTEDGQDTPGAEPAEEPAASADADAIAGVISADDFNSAVMANDGQVPQEVLDGFAAKGIDPAIIEGYAAQMYAAAEQHIESVREFLGGENGIALLQDHMAKNFSAEEISGFEEQLADPKTWRAAAMTLLSAAGLPQGGRGLIKGPNAAPSATSGESFGSEAEFNAAMADPRYKTDPAYRARVETALRNSPRLINAGGARHTL